MPNVIALRKTYSTLLDEAYKLASLTAVLDGPNDLAQEGANANEILIPKMSMSGLADYDKQTGYALGDVTLDYETKKCDYDRGRMFTVDAMDNIESAGSMLDMHQETMLLQERLLMEKQVLRQFVRARLQLRMRRLKQRLATCLFRQR